MSNEDNWGDYGEDDIRWTRPVEPAGWGSRVSSLRCGCTPDRECPRCDGEDEESTEKWAWSKAAPVVAAREADLSRALTEMEKDRIWLSFVPKRLRPGWAEEIAEKHAEMAADSEGAA